MTCKDCIHFEVCDSGRHIGEYIDDDGVYSDGVENECPAFKDKNAIEVAMDRQIPKKTSRIEKFYVCPVCGDKWMILENDAYCSICGQALDWSEDNGAEGS